MEEEEETKGPEQFMANVDEEIARQKRKEEAAKANAKARAVSFDFPNLQPLKTTLEDAVDFHFTKEQQAGAAEYIKGLKVSTELATDLMTVLVHVCRLVRTPGLLSLPKLPASAWLERNAMATRVAVMADASCEVQPILHLTKAASAMSKRGGWLEQVCYVGQVLADGSTKAQRSLWVKWIHWCVTVLPLKMRLSSHAGVLKELVTYPRGELKLADTKARTESGLQPWATGSEVHKEVRCRQLACNNNFNYDGSPVWNWVSEVQYRELCADNLLKPEREFEKAVDHEWEMFDADTQLEWMCAACAYNEQTIAENKGTPFQPVTGYEVFVEQWPRIVCFTTGVANDPTIDACSKEVFKWGSPEWRDDSPLDTMWAEMSEETRDTHHLMAANRNTWKFLREHGERETWERNPFRKQLATLGRDGIVQAAQTAKELQNALPPEHRSSVSALVQAFKVNSEAKTPTVNASYSSLSLNPTPNCTKNIGGQWEATHKNISKGFQDADEYEAVRPSDHWPDWMTYIPKEHRHLACKDDHKLFRLAIEHVPSEHPCYRGLMDTLREGERKNERERMQVMRQIYRDSINLCHERMDHRYFVLKLVMTNDALEGEMGAKYQIAFDEEWISSWRIGVTHPDLIHSETELFVTSEVVLTPKTHTGDCPTWTIAAPISKEWVSEQPPPSTKSTNADWLAWFKNTLLAELLMVHYEGIEDRAAAVARISQCKQEALNREQAKVDAEVAASALLEEEDRERTAAESKKAAKARKRQEAAARQAEEGKRASEAAAAQKRAQEAARQAKIAAKHAANERALEEKRAAQKHEQDAKFAKVLAEKQAKEAKVVDEARAAQRQAFLKHRRETECDALMARLGLQDGPPPVQPPPVQLPPVQPPPVQPPPVQPPSGRGTSARRAGRGGRGGRGGSRGTNAAAPKPPPKEDADDKLCVICMDADKTQFIVPCGHRCLCAACAEINKPSKCPICRADVAAIWNGHVFE